MGQGFLYVGRQSYNSVTSVGNPLPPLTNRMSTMKLTNLSRDASSQSLCSWLVRLPQRHGRRRTLRQETADSVRQQAIERGLRFLREHGQAEDGTFSIQAGPGLTALAITAALRNGLPVDDPMVAKGLKALEGFVKPDGGIYGNGRLKNYETCVAIVCFQLANKDGRYKELLAECGQVCPRLANWWRWCGGIVGSLVRRRELRRAGAAGPFEHQLLDRCARGWRCGTQRSGDSACFGFRVAMPELEGPAQRYEIRQLW